MQVGVPPPATLQEARRFVGTQVERLWSTGPHQGWWTGSIAEVNRGSFLGLKGEDAGRLWYPPSEGCEAGDSEDQPWHVVFQSPAVCRNHRLPAAALDWAHSRVAALAAVQQQQQQRQQQHQQERGEEPEESPQPEAAPAAPQDGGAAAPRGVAQVLSPALSAPPRRKHRSGRGSTAAPAGKLQQVPGESPAAKRRLRRAGPEQTGSAGGPAAAYMAPTPVAPPGSRASPLMTIAEAVKRRRQVAPGASSSGPSPPVAPVHRRTRARAATATSPLPGQQHHPPATAPRASTAPCSRDTAGPAAAYGAPDLGLVAEAAVAAEEAEAAAAVAAQDGSAGVGLLQMAAAQEPLAPSQGQQVQASGWHLALQAAASAPLPLPLPQPQQCLPQLGPLLQRMKAVVQRCADAGLIDQQTAWQYRLKTARPGGPSVEQLAAELDVFEEMEAAGQSILLASAIAEYVWGGRLG